MKAIESNGAGTAPGALTEPGATERAATEEEMAAFRKVLDATLRERPLAEDIEELRRWLTERPELWRAAGDLTRMTANSMIARMTRYPGTIESLIVGREELQRELGCEAAGPLERLLIGSVVLAWMRYHDVEMTYTTALGQAHLREEGAYWERRLSAAQRRYLRSIETLARVRRLALPGVQVNVTQQQVNLTGKQSVEVEG